MSSASAAPATPAQTRAFPDNRVEADPSLDFDPDHLDELSDLINHCANDETFSEAKQRERQETREAQLRKRLSDPKSARGAYLRVAIKDTGLTHARFRVLCYHLDAGDPDLSNSFTGRKTAANELGMEVATYNVHLVALRAEGYIRTQEFRKDDGTQSSSGIQFSLPGRLFVSDKEWMGPRRWNKRRSGTAKRNQLHKRAGI